MALDGVLRDEQAVGDLAVGQRLRGQPENLLTVSDKVLVSKREAARLLSLSIRTIEALITRKELVARRVGRRVLVPRTSLESFAKRDHSTRPNGQGGAHISAAEVSR